jgi:hypothetical protein
MDQAVLILMAVWGCGNTIVIYLAALQDVPRSLYESAEIDGANPWVKFRHVTVPMISPVIYFNLIMGIIGSLQVFAQAYIMLGGGGPNRSALFYVGVPVPKRVRLSPDGLRQRDGLDPVPDHPVSDLGRDAFDAPAHLLRRRITHALPATTLLIYALLVLGAITCPDSAAVDDFHGTEAD